MLKVSARPVIYKSFRYSNGKYPVKFLISFRQRMTYVVTNIIVNPEQLSSTLKIRDETVQAQVDSLDLTYRAMLNGLSQARLARMDVYDVANYLVKGKDEDRPGGAERD